MRLGNILLCLITWLGVATPLIAMDDAQPTNPELRRVPEIFKLTDQKINQAHFYQAICRGDIRVVRKMVKEGTINPHRILICHFWTKNTNIPSLQNLLTERASITTWEFSNNCKEHVFLPLVLAVAQNQLEIVRFFIEKCAIDVNVHTEEIPTALHTAVNAYNVDLVRYLLGHNAHPLYNSAGLVPQTIPNFIATALSQPTAIAPANIERLKQIQIMVNKAIATKNYPALTTYWRQKNRFHEAASYVCIDLTEEQVDQTRFYQAIYEGDLPLIKTMISQGKIDPNKTLECHFHVVPDKTASIYGWFAITNRHTLKNPEQEFFQCAPFLALNEAIVQGQSAIITFLVEGYHVNVNAHDTKNSTSLHQALNYDDPALITYLIKYGANPLHKNNYETPRTVLEQINSDITAIEELGPERIAKLKKMKPMVEKALRERQYPDPYADPESSSSSDSDNDTGDDQDPAPEASNITDSDEDDIADEDADNDRNLATKSPPLFSSSSSNTSQAIPSNSSSADVNNDGNAINHPNNPNLLPVVQNQQAPGDAAHNRSPVLQAKYSRQTIALSVIGIVCGILCIKKLYTWYTEPETKDDVQDNKTIEVNQETIENDDVQDASASTR